MRLRYLGDPGRHYPELGLLAYPDDVRELAADPGDGRWVEVDADTPLTERPGGEPIAPPVNEQPVDEHQADPEPAAAGGAVEPAGAVGAQLGDGEHVVTAAAAAQAGAGVVDEQSTSEQANTRGARRSGKENA
jgi:hypothetical protein